MTEELREYKNIIEDAVNLLGYTPLRHAILKGKR